MFAEEKGTDETGTVEKNEPSQDSGSDVKVDAPEEKGPETIEDIFEESRKEAEAKDASRESDNKPDGEQTDDKADDSDKGGEPEKGESADGEKPEEKSSKKQTANERVQQAVGEKNAMKEELAVANAKLELLEKMAEKPSGEDAGESAKEAVAALDFPEDLEPYREGLEAFMENVIKDKTGDLVKKVEQLESEKAAIESEKTVKAVKESWAAQFEKYPHLAKKGEDGKPVMATDDKGNVLDVPLLSDAYAKRLDEIMETHGEGSRLFTPGGVSDLFTLLTSGDDQSKLKEAEAEIAARKKKEEILKSENAGKGGVETPANNKGEIAVGDDDDIESIGAKVAAKMGFG